jgi:hypothetical protein
MSFHVEEDASSSAVIVHLAKDFSLQEEALAFRHEVREALEAQPNPVALVFDLRYATISSKDLLTSTDAESQAILRHEHVREAIVITDDILVQMAAKGVNSLSFGFIKVRTFPTLEEALDYAKKSAAIL